MVIKQPMRFDVTAADVIFKVHLKCVIWWTMSFLGIRDQISLFIIKIHVCKLKKKKKKLI